MYVTMVRSILKYSIQISKYVHCCILSTGNSDLQKARERIQENLNNGKSIKEQLREANRITSGIVFKCNMTTVKKILPSVLFGRAYTYGRIF